MAFHDETAGRARQLAAAQPGPIRAPGQHKILPRKGGVQSIKAAASPRAGWRSGARSPSTLSPKSVTSLEADGDTITLPATVTLVKVTGDDPGGIFLRGEGPLEVRWRVENIALPSLPNAGALRMAPHVAVPSTRPLDQSHATFPTGQVHVFVDWSNIASRLRATPPEVLLPSVLSQAGVVDDCGGVRRCSTSAGRHTEALWLEELFQSHLFVPFVERRVPTKGEQGVDSRLAVDMHALVDSQPADRPQTLVVLGGDGRVHVNGGSINSAVTAALRKGWKVQVWGVPGSIHSNFTGLGRRYPGHMEVRHLREPETTPLQRQWRPRHVPCIHFPFQPPSLPAPHRSPDDEEDAGGAAVGAGEVFNPRGVAVGGLAQGEHLYSSATASASLPLRTLMTALLGAQAAVDKVGGGLSDTKWEAACCAPDKDLLRELRRCGVLRFTHLAPCINGLAVHITGQGRSKGYAPLWANTKSRRRVPAFLHRWLRMLLRGCPEGMRAAQVEEAWMAAHSFALGETAVQLGYMGEHGTPTEDMLLDHPGLSNGPPTFRWHVPASQQPRPRGGGAAAPTPRVVVVPPRLPPKTVQPDAGRSAVVGASGQVITMDTVVRLLSCLPRTPLPQEDIQAVVHAKLRREVPLGRHATFADLVLDLPPSCLRREGSGAAATVQPVLVPTTSKRLVPGVLGEWMVEAAKAHAALKGGHPNTTPILLAQLGDRLREFTDGPPLLLALKYKSLRELVGDMPSVWATSDPLDASAARPYMLIPKVGDGGAGGSGGAPAVPAYPHITTPDGHAIPLEWITAVARLLAASPTAMPALPAHVQLTRQGVSPEAALLMLQDGGSGKGPFTPGPHGFPVPVLASTRSGKVLPLAVREWVWDAFAAAGAESPDASVLGAELGHRWEQPFSMKRTIKAVGYTSLRALLSDLEEVVQLGEQSHGVMPTFYFVAGLNSPLPVHSAAGHAAAGR